MTDQKAWQLGHTSSIFESGSAGPGTVSSGAGDHGGVSYGTYQLSSKAGTAAEYVAQSRYADRFKDLTPGTPEFGVAWGRVAADEPGFGGDQHDFIKRTHYDPRKGDLLSIGIDVNARGAAVQDMVWSTAVQYRGLTASKIERGLKERFGESYDASKLSDQDIVDAVQESKLRHVATDFRGSAQNLPGLETRIATERLALAHFAISGMPASSAEMNAYWHASAPLAQGTSGPGVTELQTRLRDLGYHRNDGAAVVADGSYGPSTREAVQSFQRTVGLPASGNAGALTQLLLKDQEQARNNAIEAVSQANTRSPVCRLDDSAHPDNASFLRTRALVHDLDRGYGREPDQRSDNLAASLIVRARDAGLARVDKIALSDDCSRLWGVERMPGARDALFDKCTSVPVIEAMNTTILQASLQWPEAMRSFEQQQQPSRAQSQQHDIQQAQVPNSAPTR